MKPDYVIHHGDCRSVLATLPEKSVHCTICSPPYWGLRKYEGVEPSWWGPSRDMCSFHVDGWGSPTCPRCDSWFGLLGLEPTIEMYVEHIVECFRAVKRVLRDDGTLWLNLGDAYSGSRGNRQDAIRNDSSSWKREATTPAGTRPTAHMNDLSPKNLIGQPWRVAFALQADGWVLRSAMPWVKRSAMPESATDRPTSALEYMFLLTKSPRYYWDMEAVRVKAASATIERDKYSRILTDDGPQAVRHDHETKVDPGGRAFRNTDLFFESLKPPYGMIFAGDELVGLDVTPAGLKEKHYASFPRKLIRPLILASTSAKGCCPECGTPWVRVVEATDEYKKAVDGTHLKNRQGGKGSAYRQAGTNPQALPAKNKTLGWKPGCRCFGKWYRREIDAGHADGTMIPIDYWRSGKHPPLDICTVLDPFVGSGQAGIVATQQGRNFIGIDASAEYVRMSERRIDNPEPEPETVDVAGQMMFEEVT